MRTRMLGAIAGVTTLGVALAWPTAAHAQDGPTPDQQAAYDAAVADLAQALSGSEPDIDALFGIEKRFQTCVGFWEAGSAYRPGPFDGHADAHYHFARLCLYLTPACNPQVAQVYTWHAAMQSSLRCVQLDKNHTEGWLVYGLVRSHRFNGEDWAAAELGFTSDLILNPARLLSHQKLTFGYLRLGRPADAAVAATAGLRYHPDSSTLHEFHGDARYELKEYDRARSAYGAAAGLDPANYGLIDKWVNADLRAQGATPDPNAALQWLAQFDQDHPAHWKAGEKRAVIILDEMWPGVWQRQGQEAALPFAEPGLQQIERLVGRFPTLARGVYWMQLIARVHRAYERYDQLAEAVVEGIRRDPSNPDAIMGELSNAAGTMNLFDHYRNAEEWSTCAQLADDLLAVLPADTILEKQRRAVLHQVKFECFLPRAMLEEAEPEIQAAIADDPSNGVYPNSYGLLLRYMGRPDDAIAQFRAALRIDTGHEWPSTNLATTLLELGKWDEFFPAMAAAMGWATDRVLGAGQELEGLMTDGADADSVAAARENVEYQKFHAANLRRLYTEGLRLQRQEQGPK